MPHPDSTAHGLPADLVQRLDEVALCILAARTLAAWTEPRISNAACDEFRAKQPPGSKEIDYDEWLALVSYEAAAAALAQRSKFIARMERLAAPPESA